MCFSMGKLIDEWIDYSIYFHQVPTVHILEKQIRKIYITSLHINILCNLHQVICNRHADLNVTLNSQ